MIISVFTCESNQHTQARKSINRHYRQQLEAYTTISMKY